MRREMTVEQAMEMVWRDARTAKQVADRATDHMVEAARVIREKRDQGIPLTTAESFFAAERMI